MGAGYTISSGVLRGSTVYQTTVGFELEFYEHHQAPYLIGATNGYAEWINTFGLQTGGTHNSQSIVQLTRTR